MTTDSPAVSPTSAFGRASTVLSVILLAIFVFSLSSKMIRGPIYEYDEGIVMCYADFWTRGETPHLDFFSNYGPGNCWVVGAAFRLIGASVDVEREVGILYRLILVASIFMLCRPRGNFVALVGAALAFLASTFNGLAAYAWVGAAALSVASIALLAAVPSRQSERRRLAFAAGAGLIAAFTALLRVDMPGMGVLIAGSVLLWQLKRREKLAYCIAWLVGMIPMVVHAYNVGPALLFDNVFTQAVFYIGPARRLPIPPDDLTAGLVMKTTLGCVALIVLATAEQLFRNRDWHAWTFAAIAILNICYIPHAFARADIPHFMYLALVAFAFAPLAFSLLLTSYFKSRVSVWLQSFSCALATAAICYGARCTIPQHEKKGSEAAHYLTIISKTPSTAVIHGRWIPFFDDNSARWTQYLVDLIGQLTVPGDRIYVGVGDLRYATINDVFLYFLVPQLKHASYHVQVDPGCSNTPGSRLASDIANAKILVLNQFESTIHDPNDTGGSDEPNRIVETLFTETARLGPYRVLVRNSNASQPAHQ